MRDLQLSSYDFDLPAELIADRPVMDRHSSKLLVFNEETQQITHSTFKEINQFLPPHSTLVFNRSKVFPCRLIGSKPSGGEAEVFILSLLHSNHLYPAMIRASGKRKEGDVFHFKGSLSAKLEKVVGDGTFLVSFNKTEEELLSMLEQIGKIPIPPYIRKGESDELDQKTYQTVYAKEQGSVAAPTAGLHFSEELLKNLKLNGHELATVTLHVGAGTFSPVKSENILEHKMHEEFYSIDQENLKVIQKAQFRVAVGTTTLRTLESSWKNDGIYFDGEGLKSTSIFLHPAKPVYSIDALVTNFHLPQSSLLMLVSALIGREKTLELYDIAIKNRYRFFSYGDGMLILRKPKVC
ncbi:MAG: tRNA preQ1(34) S-adenosylmethionine ribosyltransferase-isomerase QueA [Bacteriovoracaceae bacterium]